MLFNACRKDETMSFRFNATMEQPTNADGSKVFMHNERFIFWEVDDEITIASDNGLKDPDDNYAHATLVDAGSLGGETGDDFGFFNGVFITTLPWGSQYFLGVYPKFNESQVPNWCSPSAGSTDFGTVKMNLSYIQPRRTTTTASGSNISDLSFDKSIFPMIAWYGGDWTDSTTAFNLDFHSVASIVRLQLVNETGSAFTLDSIVFSSTDSRQLSGIFTVNNYKTEDPSLTSASNAAADKKIKISSKNGTSLQLSVAATTDTTSSPSFYLVLPAYKGRHDSTTFRLTMTVYAEGKNFARNFTVTTRRNGITYMKAIAVTDLTPATPTTAVRLVGNGTALRPFKIYTAADLVYLRDCYNGSRKINNQAITENTHICIMRSDISLHPATWTEGINNFVGHMSYTTSGVTNPSLPQGILNNSGKPLFESIGATGHVTGITVKCDTTIILGTEAFSPFCESNDGEIRDCRIMTRRGSAQSTLSTQTAGSSTYPMGGICIENHGTIIGCGCVGKFSVQKRKIGGICYSNNGLIKECYVAGPMTVSNAASAAGICYDNSGDGQVIDCYFSTIVDNANFNMGGIVYTNHGLVEHCYTRETASIISSGTVGGIVNTNATGGLVNYCWSEASLTGSKVGLIAALYTAGRIVNCFCNNPLTTVTLNTTAANNGGGGLIGEISDGSTLENCYAYINKVQRINNLGTIGGLVGTVNGTTARIKNCYVYEYASGSTVAVGYYTPNENLFDNCYIINGTQTVAGKLTAIANPTSSDFSNLKTSLDGYTPWGSEWKHWLQSGSTPPTLEAYTQTAK